MAHAGGRGRTQHRADIARILYAVQVDRIVALRLRQRPRCDPDLRQHARRRARPARSSRTAPARVRPRIPAGDRHAVGQVARLSLAASLMTTVLIGTRAQQRAFDQMNAFSDRTARLAAGARRLGHAAQTAHQRVIGRGDAHAPRRLSSRELAHRREAAAMQAARAESLQAAQVLRRGVAHVLREAIARVLRIELAHQRVARRLRQDRRRGNAAFDRIAGNDRAAGDRQPRHLVAVDERVLGRHLQPLDRPTHRQQCRLQDVELSISSTLASATA